MLNIYNIPERSARYEEMYKAASAYFKLASECPSGALDTIGLELVRLSDPYKEDPLFRTFLDPAFRKFLDNQKKQIND